MVAEVKGDGAALVEGGKDGVGTAPFDIWGIRYILREKKAGQTNWQIWRQT